MLADICLFRTTVVQEGLLAKEDLPKFTRGSTSIRILDQTFTYESGGEALTAALDAKYKDLQRSSDSGFSTPKQPASDPLQATPWARANSSYLSRSKRQTTPPSRKAGSKRPPLQGPGPAAWADPQSTALTVLGRQKPSWI